MEKNKQTTLLTGASGFIGSAVVRTLLERAPRSGPQAIEWDGRSAGGAELGSGVYFVRLEAQGRTALTRKLVLAR